MDFRTDNLRGLLSDTGLAAGNRWRVFLPPLVGMRKLSGGGIPPYNTERMNVLCTSARMPNRSVKTIERQIGPMTTRAGVGPEPGEANFTFYLTHDYTMRRYFQDWMDCVISKRGPYVAGFFDSYTRDITVQHLDKKGDPRYETKLIKCFPTNLAEIELNNQAQTAPVEVTVTIAYKDYEAKPV